jgi:hypothetical protein
LQERPIPFTIVMDETGYIDVDPRL